MTRIHLRPDLSRNAPTCASPARTWPERTCPAIAAEKAGAPDARRLDPGGVHHCRRPGFAVVLWRRGQADCRPLGAAARFNANMPPENLPSPAPARSIYRSSGRGGVHQRTTAPQATILAQAAPQDAAPAAPAALPDQTQLLQTMARDLANLERSIEQLKANQQQIASDNSKAIEELKASQEEMKRALARVSEQGPPKTSQPPSPPATAGSDLAQARADAAASESAASISKGSGCTTIGSRRFGDHRSRCAATTRSTRHGTPRAANLGCHREEVRREMTLRCAIAFLHLCRALSSHLPISGSGGSL